MIGWGTFFYGLIAGVCVAIAAVFSLIGLRRRHLDPLMVSFATYALVSLAATVAIARLHRSSSVADYRDAFAAFGFTAFLSAIALVGLVAVWTAAIPRAVLAMWGAATVVIGVLQVSLDDGLLTGEITELRTVQLLDEQFVVHVAGSSSWRPLLDVYLVGSVALIIWALVRGYRSGRRETAAVVSGALVVAVLFGAWDSLVDAGGADTPYLSPIGSLIALLGGAAYLADRAVRVEQRLANQSAQLEDIVIGRTAALNESNRQLVGQFQAQQAAARSLETLTSEFDATNRLVESDAAAISVTLQSLTEHLATAAPATRVELQLDETLICSGTTMFHAGSEVDPGAEPDDREMIRVTTRTVGELRAWYLHAAAADQVETHYLGLVAEHLSGLFHRLELVRQVADSAVESERQRIARDLHDSVTQRMYSVSFLADALVHLADDDPSTVPEQARRVRELVLSSLAELRALLFELRPDTFDDEPLGSLVEQLGEQAAATSDLRVDVDAQLGLRLPPQVKVGLYRIAQEALSNACRHSGGQRVKVTLTDAAGVASLVVRDDGEGFDPSNGSAGCGLGNLQDRAEQVGAELRITSTPGTGTVIEARWTPDPRSERLVGSEVTG